ncbi:MAG: hypothetical protein JST17_10380 [Bacteroidetes bacterium]|nr:hypothetical protein [Bacteroidota bacterium]MBS1930301.1 hypothetical protein [Bacteroidota bacterium]
MRKIALIIFYLLHIHFSYTQIFGGNPPSLKWKQIKTDTAIIIFPEGLDNQAQRVASIVHYLALHKPASLGNELRRINIVLQNQTTIANGFVALSPFRSEFFMTPDMNNFDQGSLPWDDQLAVHEYRHVMQYNNFRNGLSEFMNILFGQDGLDLAINASVPNWFFEGDAVYNETILTNQGRGRLPLFMNAFPSLWEANKKYLTAGKAGSWMKLRNGSYKDYVPNHYYLGYLLVNYGREKYGTDFWTKVTHEASAFKGLFYPFQHAIKKYSGVDYKTFYEQAFHYYQSNSGRSNSDMQLNGARLPDGQASQGTINSSTEAGPETIFPVNEKYVTNYYFPYSIGADSLLYLKSDYRHRPAFFIKDKIGVHVLKVKDISTDQQFSYRNGKIVYAAYESDPRWGWRDYGVIKLLDVKSGKQQTITHKTKYFTPDISPDGSGIAAVWSGADGENELHILDAVTGKVLKRIQSSKVSLFTDPKFINENTLVTAARLINGKMSLATVNIQTGRTIRLTPPSYNVLGYPFVQGDTIFFTASYFGNDDLFALRLSDKKIFRISNGPFGNYFVSAGNGKLTWSSFTADGYQLKQVEEKNVSWKQMDTSAIETMKPPFLVSHTDEFHDILQDSVSSRGFSVMKYSKGTGLLNFHSWRPYYEDPEFTFSIYGQNVLNTLQTKVYYLYNKNDKTNAVGLNAVYGAWFPYLNIGTQYTFDDQSMIGNRIHQWKQLDSRMGLSIPLSWAKGQFFNNFNLGTDFILRNEFNKGFYKDSLGTVSFSYLNHYFSWSQQLEKAIQHIYPRFAYAVSVNDRHVITKYNGCQFLAGASLYLPGLFSTHSLVLNGAYQQRDTLSQIVFSNLFSYSRGYNEFYFSRMWRASVNYHFPILYPDWGFGNILYLARVRGNIFYDFSKVYSNDKTRTRNQRSAGTEVFVDTKWWNQYPLTFGFRVSRLLDNDFATRSKGTVFEFVLPVSIIPR